jgi:HEPN domain-containing protein
MKGNIDLVRGWIAKADSDLAAGQRLLSDGPHDAVCFHAQQAIEKFLKALLTFYDQPSLRTHDLEELQRIALKVHDNPELANLDLFEASNYAVMALYDLQFWPNQETATEALTLAIEVKRLIVTVLSSEASDDSESKGNG